MLLLEEEKISDLTSQTPEDKRVYFNIDAETSKKKIQVLIFSSKFFTNMQKYVPKLQFKAFFLFMPLKNSYLSRFQIFVVFKKTYLIFAAIMMCFTYIHYSSYKFYSFC